MANEITEASLESAGGRVSALLSPLILQRLYDPTDVRRLLTFVPFDQIGSDTLDVTLDAVPGAFSAASSETSGGGSNSAYSTSKAQFAVSRYYKKYQMTDLMGVAGGPVDINRIANKLVDGMTLTITDLLCALFPSLANDVGPGSGNDLTVDDIYSAQFQLNNSNVINSADAPYISVLHNQQMNDFRASLRGETGAAAWQAPTAEMLATRGPGFQGFWNGIEFHQSDSVTKVNTNADYSGAMFGKGCFGYTLGSVRRLAPHIPASNLWMLMDEMFVEIGRDADNGMTTLYGNFYPAVVEIEDLRGVEIISDV